MKKSFYLLGMALSLIMVVTSTYFFIKSNNEVKEIRTQHSDLVKDYDALKVKDNSKKKEIEDLNKKIKDSTEELKKIKKEMEISSDNQVNTVVDNSQITHKTPITEYKVPSEEDYKEAAERIAKDNAEKEVKSNEPQYAVMGDSGSALIRFTQDNGITVEEFHSLNPGVELKAGQSYRIK